ncbi:hypothetical protein GH714_027291 [Hevea brasiliensis]|uniref:Autophagy-related protein 9 n=1 Tax=Hevea brasiliensis TaxID=3981 RepID=A0A6A6N6A1_HEVBR|nr:hypothetical protein GH714_027291 [Hevea brasiliensis]
MMFGLLKDVPPEIELSDYGRVPSPGSDSPSGLLNGEGLNVEPIADLDLFFESLHVTDNEIQTMQWATILEKENYLTGMLNKGVLAFPISSWVPGAGPTVKSGSNGNSTA